MVSVLFCFLSMVRDFSVSNYSDFLKDNFSLYSSKKRFDNIKKQERFCDEVGF